MAANRPWKSIFLFALLILGVGLCRQYASASGVFAAEGLAVRAQHAIDGVLGIRSIDEAEALAEEAAQREAAILAGPEVNAFADLQGSSSVQTLPAFRVPSARSLGHCRTHHCR
jgi:hypothetical protein